MKLDAPLSSGRFTIEASAGTGKTFSLTALVARHVAEQGLRAKQLLMVTFTRSAAADMRHRTRLQVRALADALESKMAGKSVEAQPWMQPALDADESALRSRLANLTGFLATYDEATITTIHGFLQILLNRAGLSGPLHDDISLVEDPSLLIRQVVGDLVVGALAEDPGMFEGPRPKDRKKPMAMSTIRKDLVASVTTVLANLDSVVKPVVDVADRNRPLSTLSFEERWAVMVENAVRTVRERLDRSDQLGFDGLITASRDLLDRPEGTVIATTIRNQFRVVMVDEFQDTDHVQWDVLSRLFLRDGSGSAEQEGAFYTVGDPKQAIYRFRGADIEAYRDAIRDVDELSVLDTNYRSNRRLISAVNALFAGVRFGADDIAYREVHFRSGHEYEGVIGSPVLEIRWVPYSEEAGSGHLAPGGLRKAEREAVEAGTLVLWKVNENEAVEAIYADTAREIASLIDHGKILNKDGLEVDIRPGDIAILVPAHAQAERLHELLSRAGVPSVRYRTQNVFETRAASDWQILLEALCQPTQSSRVRACMVSAFGEWTPEELARCPKDEAVRHVAQWQQQCADWALRLQRFGVAGLYHWLRTSRRLEPRLVNGAGGERLITDLDHIAEVLARRPGLGRGATAVDVRRELESLRCDSSSVDEYQRRIESDEAAVHIATVHYSKGLEFPVVFLPTMFKSKNSSDVVVYNDEGVRYVDVAHKILWDDPINGNTRDDRKALSKQADLGDEMRKLYVAATRAEQKLIIHWTPVSGSASSALGRVLFGRDADGEIMVAPDEHAPPENSIKSNEEMKRRLLQIRGDLEAVEIIEVSPTSDVSGALLPRSPVDGDLSVATMSRRTPLGRFGWRKWSYSGIKRVLRGDKRQTGNEGRSGHDESSDPADSILLGSDVGSSATESPDDVDGTSKEKSGVIDGRVFFPDRLAGTEFGSLAHSLLERLDPADAGFTDALRTQLHRRHRSVPEAVIPQVVTAFDHAVRTPLGRLFGDRTLSNIPRVDRRCEVSFEFGLSQTDTIGLEDIGHVMLRHLEPADPFVVYAEDLVALSRPVHVAGSLFGEIDVIFRIPGVSGATDPLQATYVLVDYKSDVVHSKGSTSPLAAYDPGNLARSMIKANYVLQAMLYAVALHRFLRLRLPDYEPSRHFGGISYLYLRGMVGPDVPRTGEGEPYGVMSWRPPTDFIEDLDLLFAGGRKAVR